MNNHEQITDKTPLDMLIDKEEYDAELDQESREEHLIQFLKETLLFILDQDAKKQEIVVLGILYALQDYNTLQLTQRQRAKEIGVSSNSISYYTVLYKKHMKLP